MSTQSKPWYETDPDHDPYYAREADAEREVQEELRRLENDTATRNLWFKLAEEAYPEDTQYELQERRMAELDERCAQAEQAALGTSRAICDILEDIRNTLDNLVITLRR